MAPRRGRPRRRSARRSSISSPDVRRGCSVLDLFAGSGALGHRGAVARRRPRDLRRHRPSRRSRRSAQNLASSASRTARPCCAGDAVALAAPTCTGVTVAARVHRSARTRSDLAVRAVHALPAQPRAATPVIVIEHDRRNAPPEHLGSLLRTDQRRYGDTLLSFYRGAAMTTDASHDDRGLSRVPSTRSRTATSTSCERALRLFDRVIVALAENVRKEPLFSPRSASQFIRDALPQHATGCEFDAFEGLLVDYCRRRGATVDRPRPARARRLRVRVPVRAHEPPARARTSRPCS